MHYYDSLTFTNSFLFLGCFCSGIVGAYFVANFAQKLGLVDYPIERSSHDFPIPKGGAIGILAAFILSSLFLEIPLTFWLSAAFLSLFSLLGDIVDIKPVIRLLLQFIAAMVLLLGAFNFDQKTSFNIYLYLLMTFLLVGTANFYNFMDGINGIAGITGVVGFGLLGYYAYVESLNSSLAMLSVCMSLACLGFLPFNMPEAKVFMGDVGAILLGFVFAGIVMMLSKNTLDFICFSSFLFPFYADELTTMVLRLRDRENLAKAHRRHFYQLLANEINIPHWKISLGYGVSQFLIGTIVLIVKPFGFISVLLLLTLFSCAFVFLSFGVRKKLEYI